MTSKSDITYDYIIIGAGISGLSLALHLARSPLCGDRRRPSMLLVDKETKDQDDRTLAFWTDRPTDYEEIISQTWSQLRWQTNQQGGCIDLGNYRYQVIRAIDFYRYAHKELSTLPNITMLHSTVRSVRDDRGCALVSTNGETYRGRWAFDSRLRRADWQDSVANSNNSFQHLKLHFEGWEIETANAAFETSSPTFFDFRTPKENQARFFYVLPYSDRRALVEFTLFSDQPLLRHKYTKALENYLHIQGIHSYKIHRRESGCLPISDRPYPRQLGERILAIGIKGGRLKPSSGYAFTRIQADSAAIVASLLSNGHPFDLPLDSARYRLYDSLLLEVMGQHGEAIESIFCAMFNRNPSGRILRFLDERGTLWENLALIATLPPNLFIQTLLQRAARSVLRPQSLIEFGP